MWASASARPATFRRASEGRRRTSSRSRWSGRTGPRCRACRGLQVAGGELRPRRGGCPRHPRRSPWLDEPGERGPARPSTTSLRSVEELAARVASSSACPFPASAAAWWRGRPPMAGSLKVTQTNVHDQPHPPTGRWACMASELVGPAGQPLRGMVRQVRIVVGPAGRDDPGEELMKIHDLMLVRSPRRPGSGATAAGRPRAAARGHAACPGRPPDRHPDPEASRLPTSTTSPTQLLCSAPAPSTASSRGEAPITVNADTLKAAGLVRRADRLPLKVLGH